MTYQHQEFPAARYGPNGAVVIVNSEDETPKGFLAKRDKGAADAGGAGMMSPTPSAGTSDETNKKTDPSTITLDADGHAYDPKFHAATQSKTKAGLWRMKVGVARPAPSKGYPKPPLDL